VVTETVEKTVVRKEGEVGAGLLKEEKLESGIEFTKETHKKDELLLEDEEWVVDEKGERKKQKKGFFGQLKDKITGHH
jgi:hypothetical protein